MKKRLLKYWQFINENISVEEYIKVALTDLLANFDKKTGDYYELERGEIIKKGEPKDSTPNFFSNLKIEANSISDDSLSITFTDKDSEEFRYELNITIDKKLATENQSKEGDQEDKMKDIDCVLTFRKYSIPEDSKLVSGPTEKNCKLSEVEKTFQEILTEASKKDI